MSGEFRVYAIGLINASVCSSLSLDETTARLNREHPTGVGPWYPSSDKQFAGGGEQPGPCNECPDTHKHYLFHC